MERQVQTGMAEYTAAERVALARNTARPGVVDYVQGLFTDFFEQKGDRLCGEDPSIFGGIGLFHGRPVTVIGHRKGHTLEEHVAYHFGMPSPEGYRKAQRLMLQAEKFRRPIVTFIDTAGAYPGLEAEAHGQGEAIARMLAKMSALTVPTIAIVTGEGGSGGALALGVGNRVFMLENAVYSVLSPEGFAAILWKDSSRSSEACDVMKLTAADLLTLEDTLELLANNSAVVESSVLPGRTDRRSGLYVLGEEAGPAVQAFFNVADSAPASGTQSASSSAPSPSTSVPGGQPAGPSM